MSFAPELMLAIQVFGPAVAAYVAVKIGVAVATERADQALRMAKRAHERIDNIMDRGLT